MVLILDDGAWSPSVHLTKWNATNWIYGAGREHIVHFQLYSEVAYNKRSLDYLFNAGEASEEVLVTEELSK